MAFVVAGGGVLIWRISHDNHSNYSDWREHSNHQQYGDSALRNEISNKENRVNRKAADVANLRQQMNDNFNHRIAQLKRERNYSGLNAERSDIIRSVKADMRREIDEEIARDRQELAEIDKMIARINELELKAKKE